MGKVKKWHWIDVEAEVCSIGHFLWAIFCYIKMLLRFPYRLKADVVVEHKYQDLDAGFVEKIRYWFVPRLKIKWKRE